jgi:hypothetical protein
MSEQTSHPAANPASYFHAPLRGIFGDGVDDLATEIGETGQI